MRIEISQLSKRYDTRAVISNLDLNIQSGEFVAVVGASGSGKSTLLRLLVGLEVPTGGSISVDGKYIRGLNANSRMMFQDARLLPWKTVIGNVALGLSRAEIDRGTEVLNRVGLLDRHRDWPSVLSGGQRQRVALARALARNPRLLLLDEPLASLDALTRIEMQALIEKLWIASKFTAVLVTHDCGEAVALADRVLLLENATIAMETKVPLPRPRDRTAREFAQLEGQVLRHILANRQLVPASKTTTTNRVSRADNGNAQEAGKPA